MIMPSAGGPASRDRGDDSRFGRTDFLMLLAVLFWALNFPAIKLALREFSPHGFNGPRLALASSLLLAFLWRKEGGRHLCRSDVLRIVVLGLVGNTFYQVLFINGISQSSASRTSLVMTMTPIVIALLSAVFLQERIHREGWAGIFLSLLGLWMILSRDGSIFSLLTLSLKGDLLILLGDLFWAVYTVFSKPLLSKISPLRLTTLTLAAGTLFYLPLTVKDVVELPLGLPSPTSWAALLFSSVLAIAASYLIWYSSVKRIGSAKTGIYVNIAPVLTVFFARIFLSERMTARQLAGALIIIIGSYLTRSGDRWLSRRR
jgi:drug/metabolite transporter (DMT)-like permease